MKKYFSLGAAITAVVVLLALIAYLGYVNAQLWQEQRATQSTAQNTTQNATANTVANNSTNTASSNTVSNPGTNTVTTNTTPSTTPPTNQGSCSTVSKPTLVSSQPAANSTEKTQISKVSLTFDCALDPTSTAQVFRKTANQEVTSGSPTFSNANRTIEVGMNTLHSDDYSISYTACLGANTNCTIGSVGFKVTLPGDTRTPAPATVMPNSY